MSGMESDRGTLRHAYIKNAKSNQLIASISPRVGESLIDTFDFARGGLALLSIIDVSYQ